MNINRILYIKLFLFSIILLAMQACTDKEKNKKPEVAVIKENLAAHQTIHNKWDGNWFLSNYFDGIATDKSISKYRTLAPTYFGIMLNIKNDSISGGGSIWGLKKQSLNYNSDTITQINIMGKWCLIKKGTTLHLKHINTQKLSDTVTYIYSKRADIQRIVARTDSLHNFRDNMSHYFNTLLLAGEYKMKTNNTPVTFKTNGEVIGLKDFTRYKVYNYFGTLQPFLDKDVVFMYGKNDSLYSKATYNWTIKKNQLILTNFTNPTLKQYNANKKKGITGDYYVLGNERIVLLKQ